MKKQIATLFVCLLGFSGLAINTGCGGDDAGVENPLENEPVPKPGTDGPEDTKEK